MAFLSKYRQLRSGEAEDEVEYNFGRAFHQLGMAIDSAQRPYLTVRKVYTHLQCAITSECWKLWINDECRQNL
jgi:hypothetical protein